MKFNLRLIALLIAMLMLLTSCESVLEPLLGLIPGLQTSTTETTTTTKWKPKPTTTNPTTTGKVEDDTPKFNRADVSTTKEELILQYTLTTEEVDAAMALLDSMVDASINAETIEEVDALYDEFEITFYRIAQQMTLASIIYYCDMDDPESSERYESTTDIFYDLQDKYMVSCRTMYLESKFSAELFEGWSEEELKQLEEYDPALTDLKKEIKDLEMQYDALEYGWGNNGEKVTDQVTEIYIQMVTKNNELARYYGYDNYYDYATANVYGRDYTADDLASFREYVIKYIVPNRGAVSDAADNISSLKDWRQKAVREFTQGKFDAGKTNYLINYLDSLEGAMGEGMRHMFENKNCVFSNMGTSHPTAFQTYLYEDEKPFCLFGSTGQSATTMVHEIGHYYAAYSNADIDNYDLCETHSQGNEFLFVKYCESSLDKEVYRAIKSSQLGDTYTTILASTIIDAFEQRVYSLDSVEGMTSADFDQIMTEVCEPFGNASSITDFTVYWRLVAVSNPVYYISYAVSAVAALEICALAEEDYASALTAYNALVEGIVPEDGFLGALEKAALTSPFEEQTYINITNNLVEG